MFHRNSVVLMTATLFCSGICQASDQVATLTLIQGTVKVFSHPGKKIDGPAPHALYENEYYSVHDAKAGDRVEQGNIVRTAPGAKVRVVFDNGDQFNVGPATAYRVFWDKDAAEGKMRVNLMYGKLRGVIEKGGPRSRLMIRTRSATMGVRGTDFFIADGGDDGGTEVSILRGAVEVKPEAPSAKPIEVKAGYSAEIPAPTGTVQTVEATAEKAEAKTTLTSQAGSKTAGAPVVELRKTTQEDLIAIQKSSAIKAEIKKELVKSEETLKTIQKLENRAVETTLKDIKAGDPKLYAQIQSRPVKSTEELNSQAVQNLLREAPKAPEKRKPFKSELEDLEKGAYEKYFKIVD